MPIRCAIRRRPTSPTFPTKSGYPVHPELKGDPFRETVDLCKQNGMRVVAYVPLNHPFMDATSKDPRYADWSQEIRRRHADDDGALRVRQVFRRLPEFAGARRDPRRWCARC